MALAVGNDGLLKAVSVGDLAANEISYHKNCYKTLVANYKKVTEKGSNDKQNVAWKNCLFLIKLFSSCIMKTLYIPEKFLGSKKLMKCMFMN